MSKLFVDEIRHSGGANAAMQFDSTGRVTTPARPAFLVSRTATITLTGGDSHQVLPFDDVRFDIGSNFSTANNHYVCPVDGIYFFALNIRLDALTQGTGLYIRAFIYRGNDASTVTTPWNSKDSFLGMLTGNNDNQYEAGICSGVLQCTAGDIVTAMGGHVNDASISFNLQSQFSGFLVG